MTRLLTVFSAFFLAGPLVAQPIIEFPDIPPTGVTASIFTANAVDPTPAGDEPQVWDFSDVSGSFVAEYQLAPASSSAFSALFPDAEWIDRQGQAENFWKWDDAAKSVVGIVDLASTLSFPLEDALTIYPHPFTLGDVHEDSFAIETVLAGFAYSSFGSITIEADAFGSLIMPGGEEVSSVLRCHVVQETNEVFMGDTTQYLTDNHLFLAPDSVQVVVVQETLTILDASGTQLSYAEGFSWYDGFTLSTPELTRASLEPPFPNPVSAGGRLTWSLPDGWSWKAMGVDGRLVDKGAKSGTGPLSLSTVDWPMGTVLLVAESSLDPALQRVFRVLVH